MSPSSFLARLRESFDTRQARLALVDERERLTFGALGERVAAASACLRRGRASLEGERVALLVPPGAPWVEAFLGTLAAGGTAVPLSHLHPPAELAYFVEDAGARTLVVAPEYEARTATLGEGRRLVTPAALRAERPTLSAPAPTDDDVALMLYTSGTTGRPKGAMLTHHNLAIQARLLRDAWGWSDDDSLLHALPLHHLHGLGIALMTALAAGASTRMLPRFDAAAVWDAMSDATVFMGVPTMYHKLFEAYDAADAATRARWTAGASRLRLSTSGSAALPVGLAERWRAVTGSYPLERFGMTEIGVGMTNPLAGPRKAGSVGLPLPTVGLRIVDEARRDVAVGEPGELWISGPSVFKGYWRKEEATRAAFEEGWFRTGDIGVRDDEGYVRLLGRSSVDILKSGGYKLSALEIEDALRDNEAVAEIAVVGIPDDEWGELVVAAVVPRAGREEEASEERLRGWAKGRLAPYKVPRRVVAMSALPRNAIGKVQKPELKRLLGEKLGR